MTKSGFALAILLSTFGFSTAAYAGSAEIACVQGELNKLGFYDGAIDGKISGPAKSAAKAYIQDMKAKNPGWNMADLDANTAGEWCHQVGAAHFDKLYKVLIAYQGEGTGVVNPYGLKVPDAVSKAESYVAKFDLDIRGGAVTLTDACFTWNGNGKLCVPLPAGKSSKHQAVELTAGRPGTYTFNVFVKYESAGKSFNSPETSVNLVVK